MGLKLQRMNVEEPRYQKKNEDRKENRAIMDIYIYIFIYLSSSLVHQSEDQVVYIYVYICVHLLIRVAQLIRVNIKKCDPSETYIYVHLFTRVAQLIKTNTKKCDLNKQHMILNLNFVTNNTLNSSCIGIYIYIFLIGLSFWHLEKEKIGIHSFII